MTHEEIDPITEAQVDPWGATELKMIAKWQEHYGATDALKSILASLVATYGKKILLEWWQKRDVQKQLWHAICQAHKDEVRFGSNEAWIVPYGNTLTYMPSYKLSIRQWRHANPNCSLKHRVWSVKQFDLWMEQTGNHREPYPNESPVYGSKEEAREMIQHGPAHPDWECCFVQVVKVSADHLAGEVYGAKELEKMAGTDRKGPTPVWRNWPDQMYAKTAIRRFIKWDMGLADNEQGGEI